MEQLHWGMQPDRPCTCAWGAKAIYQPSDGELAIHVFWGAQSIAAEPEVPDSERLALCVWVSSKGLPALHKQLIQLAAGGVASGETALLEHTDERFRIIAKHDGSSGHLYLCAMTLLSTPPALLQEKEKKGACNMKRNDDGFGFAPPPEKSANAPLPRTCELCGRALESGEGNACAHCQDKYSPAFAVAVRCTQSSFVITLKSGARYRAARLIAVHNPGHDCQWVGLVLEPSRGHEGEHDFAFEGHYVYVRWSEVESVRHVPPRRRKARRKLIASEDAHGTLLPTGGTQKGNSQPN